MWHLLRCILCTSLCLVEAMGQDLKEVTNKDGLFVENYTVLKKNKSIKHGNYERYLNERLWEKGQYEQGQRTGLWEFYGSRGVLDQQYDYTTRHLVFAKEYQAKDTTVSSVMSQIIRGRDTSAVHLDKPAVPIGGSYRLSFLLMSTLRFPASAQRLGHNGLALVTYAIDEKGQFIGCRLLRSSGNREVDQEALRVVSHFSDLEWIAAQYEGKPVTSILTQPVRFLSQ